MRWFVLFLFAFISNFVTAQCNTGPFVKYNITANSGTDIYYPSGNPTWKGGDTLEIDSTVNYSLIHFGGIKGDACHPLTIRFKGVTNISGQFRIKDDCAYLNIIGDTVRYGIKCTTFIVEESHDITAGGVECSGGNNGLFVRQVPDSTKRRTYYDALDLAGNYTWKKLYFHNFYIHDCIGEAAYVLSTSPNGNTYGGKFMIPARSDSGEIRKFIVINAGWDGIQLSNGGTGWSIHDNYIYNFGTLSLDGQRAGIIVGANTNANVYNNRVIFGKGNGIQIFGFGNIKVFNNTIDSVGRVDSSVAGVFVEPRITSVLGEHSFVNNDYTSTVESRPAQQIEFYNNAVNHPMPRGAIRLYSDNSNSLAASVINNTFCIPNAQETWQSQYILTSAIAGTTQTNNTLYCPTVLSICSVNCDPINPIPPAERLEIKYQGDRVSFLSRNRVYAINMGVYDMSGRLTDYADFRFLGSKDVLLKKKVLECTSFRSYGLTELGTQDTGL